MKKVIKKKKENSKKAIKKPSKKGRIKDIKKIKNKLLDKKADNKKKTEKENEKKVKPKTGKHIKKEEKINKEKRNIGKVNRNEITKKEIKTPLKEIEKKEKILITTSKIQETVKKKEPEILAKTAINISTKDNIQKTIMINQNTPYFTILFVCTGNMCRSPLAEGIMKKKIEEEFSGDEKDLIMIHSCGTYAYEGNKPSENALKTAKQNSTDISYIRSKPLTKLIADEADIIFAMSVEHMNYIVDNFLSAKNKTFLLKQFGENRLTQMSDSIPDPMGFTIDYYAKTYQEIKNAIDKVFPLIKENIQKKLQIKVEKTN